VKGFLVIVLASSFVSFSIYEPTPRPTYFEVIFEKLKYAESDNFQWAVSPAGAVGICQIIPIGLKEHNRVYRTNFTMKQMANDIDLNILTGRRIFSNLIERHNGDYIKAINSYNMGIGNTKLNRFNYKYLEDISPLKWEVYQAEYGVIWKGKAVLNLGRKNIKMLHNRKHKVSSVP
jgi:hypothetical protein